MGCCCKKKVQEGLIDKKQEKEMENKKNQEEPTDNISVKITYDDFEPLKLLGTGSFGRVLLVRYKNNNNLYAMKVLIKEQIKHTHQEIHTKTERDLMVKINNPFIINIKFAFQDKTRLYIVTEFMQGGDIFYHLHSIGKFPEPRAKFYFIELILAIEHLHKNNMIYRDLKPENILMDIDGHLRISDFGLSKILKKWDEKTYSLCGTPQYLAPEVLSNKGYDKNIDWWSLGVLFYEMITGYLPFYIPKNSKIELDTFNDPIQFPENISPEAQDIIKKLLIIDPKKRLGYGENGAQKIKEHKYFQGVIWEKYWNKEIQPPFVPVLDDEMDLKYFDKIFTEESIDIERPTINNRLSKQNPFIGFTYVTNSVKKELLKVPEENNE